LRVVGFKGLPAKKSLRTPGLTLPTHSSLKLLEDANYLLVLQEHDSDLLSLGGLNETFIVAMGGFVRDPEKKFKL
jgi:hypothetical protein